MNGNRNMALAPVVEQVSGQLLEVRDPQPDPRTLLMIAEQFAQSGFFQDAKQAAQAFVKVQYGAELGIGPATAMMSVQVIQGKPAPSAGLLAALIKRSGKYNFRVVEWTNQQCALQFFEDGKAVGNSVFTIEDARQAGALEGPNKHTWAKYPRNMLFARALTNGQRVYCADVTLGPVYTPEELDVPVDSEGNVIDVTPAPPAPHVASAADADTKAIDRALRSEFSRLGIKKADEMGQIAALILDREIPPEGLSIEERDALRRAQSSFKDASALSAHLDRLREEKRAMTLTAELEEGD